MTLKLTTLNITNPMKAQVSLSDEDECRVFVHIELSGKPIEEFTLKEIAALAKEAAKHLVSKA